MESQTAGQHSPQGQGQRYCPTPVMAPPPSSPAPSPLPGVPIQHQPQHHQPPPSISPSPHPHHTGYYSHHPQQHSYPQQNPYYQGYYSHAHHHGQPSPNPPPPSQHYQQWGHTGHHHNHGYYQQTPQAVASPQHQVSGYPPQAQSPYGYVQHPPAPTQQHQGQSIGSQPPQQQQSQHALMNLSLFVSQQSPCPSPSPIPHPHSPTTPVPMGSPHYPQSQQQGQMPQQTQCQSQVSHQHHLQTQQHQGHQHHHPGASNTPGSPLHQGSYPTSLPTMKSQQNQPNSLAIATANSNLNSISNHNQVINNTTSSRTDQVQNPSSLNHEMSPANVNSFPMGVSNEGRSGSSSPSGIGSGRPLYSPPATSSSSGASNGQMMIPVRLQNMQKGARTKASMRKLMQEQQNSNQQGTSYDGPPTSDHDTESESRSEASSKKSAKTPKTPRKGRKGAKDGDSMEIKNKKESPAKRKSESANNMDADIPENQVIMPGYTKKGKKIGRPPKPKPIPDVSEQTPKKKGRKPKTSMIASVNLSPEIIPDNSVAASIINSSSSSSKVNVDPEVSAKSIKQAPMVKDSAENTKTKSLKSPYSSMDGVSISNLRTSKSPTPSAKDTLEEPKVRRLKSPTPPTKEENHEELSIGCANESTEVPRDETVLVDEKQATPVKEIVKVALEVKDSPPMEAIKEDDGGELETPDSNTKSQKKKSPPKRGRKPKATAKKSAPEEDDWILARPATESESEHDLEAIETTPTGRPLRARAIKEPAKVDESKTPERSRKARARRSSRSYKESSMSTSRSKSPKDLTPSKKSKKAVSPPKASPKEQKVTPKSSPRLKAASPSPVRVRQLKEQTPIQNRRETRSSKERDETPTPTRGLRGRKAKAAGKGKIDLPSDESPSPVSRKKSAKQIKDTTPGRVSSPRVAKGRKGGAVKSPVKSRSSIDEESAIEESPPKPRSTGRVTRGKRSVSKEVVEKAEKSRKRKASGENLKSDATDESEAVVKEKKSKVSTTTAKKRKGKGRKSIENQESVESQETEKTEPVQSLVEKSESEDLVTSGTDLQTSLDTSIESETTNQNETGLSSEEQTSGVNANFEIESPAKSEVEQEIKVKVIQRRASALEGRRRSNSPRLTTENINPVVVLPHLPTSISQEKLRYGEGIPSQAISNSSITPTGWSEKTGLEVNTTISSTVVPKWPGQLPVSDMTLNVFSPQVETSTHNTPVAVEKPKKPRKPRTPKNKILPVEEKPDVYIESQKNITEIEPPLPQLPQLQLRQDNKEIEVAQALLDMKLCSKTPSPVKFDPIVAPYVGPPLELQPAKPRKRKSTGSAGVIETQIVGQGTSPMVFSVTDINTAVSSMNNTCVENVTPAAIKGRRPSAKSKAKKQRLSTESEAFTSNKTILAVPQVNGNQTTYTPTSSSTPLENTLVRGPVKVSKTVLIPGRGGSAPMSSPSSVDETIARVAANYTQIFEERRTQAKQRKKKTVVPKSLTPTAVTEGQLPGVRVKRKYTRRKKINTNEDNQLGTTPEHGISNSTSVLTNGPTPASTPLQSMSLTGTPVVSPVSPGKDATKTDPSSKSPSPKRRRKSSRPEPFALNPKPVPIPTVFVKSPPLATMRNGPTAGTSTDGKERSRVGPSLKVVRGRTKFYRGSDEEELDAEPQLSKRGAMQFDPEVPWLCCFCNLGPHAQKLGDLFGPYYTEPTSTTGKAKTVPKRETWMHQDCALWAGSVVLIGSKLHGLEQTLSHSNEDSCTTCGKKGATIGCLKRGCKQAVHYPCAIRKSWKLDEESFHSFCPAHIT